MSNQQVKLEEELCEGEMLNSPQLLSESDSGCESDNKMDGKSKHGKKRKGYSKEITKVLNDWFFANLQNPYPSEEEKKEMANHTFLSLLQINNWFSNKRVRYKRKMQKEGQEVVDGGVDINQAFRSIKKQNKGEKKENNSQVSQQTPKRKRSSATKDISYTKKKRPTPLVKPENDMNTITAHPIISTSPVSSSSSAVTATTEPKTVLSSLLESPSNMNMNGNSVVLLRSPILNGISQTSPTLSGKVPDEKSNEENSPKRIDFFQSLQQAGVIFPQNTPTVIPVMPSYPYTIVHHHHSAPTYHVDPYQQAIQYPYPIYSAPFYAPHHAYVVSDPQVDEFECDESSYFEMESGSLEDNVNVENFVVDNSFGHDLFMDQEEHEDSGLFENVNSWTDQALF